MRLRLLALVLTAAFAPAASAAVRHHRGAYHHGIDGQGVSHKGAFVRRPAYAYGYRGSNDGYRGNAYAYPGYGYDGGYGYRGPTSATADATLNGNTFNAGAAQIPPPGIYNSYQGPGATVLRRGLESQFEPGVTSDLFPGAKQTATGGPSGGVPGAGGGR